MPHKKPAPDIHGWALERMQLAASAGVPTLVTVSAFTLGEDFSSALAVLSDLGEPGAPARTLAGLGPKGGVVDLAYLRALAALAP
ncbi:MAG: hypothetical protein ACLPYS_04955 [Vulcanimicrobiaceae bacterium]